jgi:hypothetical protein
MRFLQRLQDRALADLGDHCPCGRDFPVFPIDVIGRLAFPDLQDRVDRLDQHLVPIVLEIAEAFGIGHQPAGTDAEIETAVQHVIEHGDLRGDGRRVVVRHVDRTGAEPHALGVLGDPGEKHRRGGDGLGKVSDMLADIALGKAEFLREQERFAILCQSLPPVATDGMDRHGEKAELHHAPL